MMVTRRKFGYGLRDGIQALDENVSVALSFSESILEEWPVRESFLFFCLLSDPDPATWRAWLAYRNATSSSDSTAPERNAGAYLQFLTKCEHVITPAHVRALASEDRNTRRGRGGRNVWDRARRYVSLIDVEDWDRLDPRELIEASFSPERWGVDASENSAQAQDLQLLRDKALELFDAALLTDDRDERAALQRAARDLRYTIATREPFTRDPNAKVTVATLWGAKGLTADHVYVLGLCDQAIPGDKTDDYPGDDADYLDEQRRLFYVSITRARKTLVLSRAEKVRRGDARKLRLRLSGSWHWMTLIMSRFLREVIDLLPAGVDGDDWTP